MQFNWRKDNKYYKLRLQTNLFGATDIICSWGSIISNYAGYKIISCQNQQEIDNAIKLITKRRKTRGYLLTNYD